MTPTDEELRQIWQRAASVRGKMDSSDACAGRAAFDAVLALLAKPREGDDNLHMTVRDRVTYASGLTISAVDVAAIIALVRQHDADAAAKETK